MKFLDNSERLMILISISDRLWEDYNKGELTEKDYIIKSDEIRDEISKIHNITFSELQSLASNIGYILVKNKNTFTSINNFSISIN